MVLLQLQRKQVYLFAKILDSDVRSPFIIILQYKVIL